MVKQTKTPGKAIVKWDEELANLAKQAVGQVKLSSAKFMSVKSGRMSFAGANIPDNEIDVVILGWIYENQYYDSAYDPDNSQGPVCYAFGTVEDEMAPRDNVPEKISDACAECPLNEWDSAPSGKGKACKNVIRVAFIPENDLDDLDSAEIIYLKVSVSSTKNFLSYIAKDLRDKLRRPFWSVVTNISVVPDPKSQFKINFKAARVIDDSSLFPELKAGWENTMQEIDFDYPPPQEKPVKVKPKASKFTKRK